MRRLAGWRLLRREFFGSVASLLSLLSASRSSSDSIFCRFAFFFGLELETAPRFVWLMFFLCAFLTALLAGRLSFDNGMPLESSLLSDESSDDDSDELDSSDDAVACRRDRLLAPGCGSLVLLLLDTPFDCA